MTRLSVSAGIVSVMLSDAKRKQLRPASGENEHFFVAVTLKVADAPKDYVEADSKMTHSHFKHVNLQPVFKNTLIPI